MSEAGGCKHPEQHHHHLCVLGSKLSKSELSSYVKDPRYLCANCGGRTHEGKNLCNPKKIRRQEANR